MSLLIRKIDRNNWIRADTVPHETPADAITRGCMKTKDNTLSVWEAQDENKIDEAVLAIVSACHHLEAIDIVQIDREHLEENEIDCRETDGDTPVKDLVNTHIDLSNLAYKELGIIAYHILDKFRQDKVKRYTKTDLKQILKDAIEKQRLEIDELKEFIREKLEKELG